MQYVIIKAQRPDTALRLGCGIHGTQPVVVAAAAAAAQRFRWRPQACDSDGPGIKSSRWNKGRSAVQSEAEMNAGSPAAEGAVDWAECRLFQ